MQVSSPAHPLRAGPLSHLEYHQVLRAHSLSAASFLLAEIAFIESEAPMFLHVPVASRPIPEQSGSTFSTHSPGRQQQELSLTSLKPGQPPCSQPP